MRAHDVAQVGAEHPHRLARALRRRGHLDRVVAEVGEPEVAQQHAAVGVRVRAHAALAGGRRGEVLVARPALLVEQLLGAVGAHPRLELAQVLGVVGQAGERNLVRAPRPLRRLAVDLLRPGPALRRAQDDHRPARALEIAVVARAALDLGDLVERAVERGGERLVHRLGIVAGDEARRVPVALQQRAQLVLGDPREQRRVGDLVAVEMQDRQHRAVARRVDELVRVPARRQRPRLGLAVADDAADEQVRVVERSAVGVHERVAELAALVDRARRLRRDVARDPAGERELAEQLAHALFVARDVGVDLGVAALEPGRRDKSRAAVPGAGDVHRVEVALHDCAVHVRVEQVEAGGGAPVAEQPRLDVLERQRLTQQRVVEQVDLADGEVIGGAPPRVDALQLVAREGRGHEAAP